MRLLDKQAQAVSRWEGRLSDGSDRAEVVGAEYVVHMLDDLGRELVLRFGHDPSDAEVLAVLVDPPELAPSTRADYERGPLQDRYEAWQRWKTTRIEAQARGVAAVAITALQAREDATWASYLSALNAWRLAT